MKPQTERTYKERMLCVLVHIQQHLDEALALEELAGLAHFSPYHFHRVFQGMVGESLMAHVRRLRLERAALRLKHTDQPVTRIAFEAGYETHEAFTRAFRALFGESPTGFRAIHQPLALPDTPSGVHYDPDAGLLDFTPHYTGGMPMEASIKKMSEMRVAFARHVGPYQEVGPTWGKLCAWAGPRGLFGPRTVLLGLCHDDPCVTPPERIRYDACIVVGDHVQAEGDIGIQTIPAGDYATTIHGGPYTGLAQTYARLCGEWIPQQGRELRSAPSIEIYQNDPNRTPPEELRTEVCVPLE
jgi:AraC family transcriptional regulator